MPERNLEGTAAIVTGGALGIGGGTARRLAEEGASVLIVDVAESAARDNAKRIADAGGKATYMAGDVAQNEVARAMVEKAVADFGRLDILVQNAYGGGADRAGSAVEVTEKAFDEGLGLLVRALFLGAKHAVPAMVESGPYPNWKPGPWQGGGRRHGRRPAENVGRIVNMSSVHGLLMSPKALIYETGKSAVIGMTKQMAMDFSPLGITVNAIAPGHIVTERGEQSWQEVANDEGFKVFELQYPVRRTGLPADIANGVAFFCSPLSGFVTGVTLPVDGGLSIQLQEDIVMDMKDYIAEHPKLKTHFDVRKSDRARK